MPTITTPKHRKPRPGLSAKVAPAITSRKGLVVTGTLLSVPATAASLVQAAPSFADPSGGATSTTGHSTAATGSGRTTADTATIVYLRYGATGSLVKTAQQRLGGLQADGVFGSLTLAKVKSFQRSKGLVADGVIGPLTWVALGGFPGTTSPPTTNPAPTPTPTPTPPPAPTPTPPSCTVQVLRYGSTGSNVAVAQ